MMMVYDSFKGHLEESVKEKFRDSGFYLAVIPGGLTSLKLILLATNCCCTTEELINTS